MSFPGSQQRQQRQETGVLSVVRGEMMRPGAKHYVVSRPLYSEESFAEEHQKVSRQRKSMLDHVKQYLT